MFQFHFSRFQKSRNDIEMFPHQWYVNGMSHLVYPHKEPVMHCFVIFCLFFVRLNELLKCILVCNAISYKPLQLLIPPILYYVGLIQLPVKRFMQKSQRIKAVGSAWWRHQMETFSASLALCAGNSPVTSEFPLQRPVMRSFDVFLICAWINGWVKTVRLVIWDTTTIIKTSL